MHSTVKEISETLFIWLGKLVSGEKDYKPDVIEKWNAKDWQVAQSIVFIHGMGPVWGGYWKNTVRKGFVPIAFYEYLVLQYNENSKRIKKIQNIYNEISQVCRKKRISIVPFKGIHLARQIYEDIGQRPMADIDLYINSSDMEKLKLELGEIGFIPAVIVDKGATFCQKDWLSEHTFFPIKAINSRRDEFLFQGESDKSPIGIDIHLNMEHRSVVGSFDLTQFFDECLNKNNNSLAGEIYFIYILLHAAKHILTRTGRWLHLYDIYLLLKKENINEDKLIEYARSLNVSHLLVVPLALCRKIFKHEFSNLEKKLLNQVGWRHRLLVDSLELSERSCCFPWMENPLFQFVWANDVSDIVSWFVIAKNRRKTTLIRQSESLVKVEKFWLRALNRIKGLVFRQPRDTWNCLAVHGMNPRTDWK